MNSRSKYNLKINVVKYGFSILATFVIGAIMIYFQGESPVNAIQEIIKGAFGSKINIGNTLHWLAPSVLAALSALVAFKSGVMNLGQEGQIYFGALAAACAGYMVKLPGILHPLFCILVGGLFGVLWALIPALLRMFFNINELISTLILNYVAVLVTELITLILMKGGTSTSSTGIQTKKIHESARLTVLIKGTSATTAVFIAILFVIIIYLIYKYTIVGYELKQVGQNLKFARAGGVNANKVYMSIFILSGFIAGVCGAVETLGVNHRFISTFSPNLGWDGVMISRVAANNPIGLMFVSALWSTFKAGSLQMERVTTLNRYVIYSLQAILVLFVSINYDKLYQSIKTKIKLRKNQLAKKEVA